MSAAIWVSLYSAVLVVLAYLMSRRGSSGSAIPDSAPDGLFRGAGLALCVAALVLPATRLVGTREPADVLILLGTMAAVAAATVPLARASSRATDSPPSAAPGLRTSSGTRPDGSFRRAVRPGSARPSDGLPDSVALGDPADTPRERPSPAVDQVRSPVSPADQVSETLHEVDAVVDQYSARLGLHPRRPRAGDDPR